RDDEWIEVVNAGATPLALDGFILTDGDSLPRLALTGTLAPGEHLMATGKQSYDWEKATGHPAFGFSLANSGDAAMLCQVAGAVGEGAGDLSVRGLARQSGRLGSVFDRERAGFGG